MVMGEERGVLPHVMGHFTVREKIDVAVGVVLIRQVLRCPVCCLTLSDVLCCALPCVFYVPSDICTLTLEAGTSSQHVYHAV